MDETTAYRSEPHVIPLGAKPAFGVNLYALGIELLLLGAFIALAAIARRRGHHSDRLALRRVWYGGCAVSVALAVLFLGAMVYISCYRMELPGFHL